MQTRARAEVGVVPARLALRTPHLLILLSSSRSLPARALAPFLAGSECAVLNTADDERVCGVRAVEKEAALRASERVCMCARAHTYTHTVV